MPRRRNAAPKDPNAPKRAPSSYMVYNKARFAQFRADPNNANIKSSASDLTKMFGADWKAMTAEQKRPYEEEAKQGKENFIREMEEYKRTNNYARFQEELKQWKKSQKENAATANDDGEDERPAVRAKVEKRPKDPNRPKKPLSSFFIFKDSRMAELKQTNPDKKHQELLKLVSSEWRTLTAEQKEPFESQAKAKKELYNTEMEAYKETDNFMKHQAEVAAWQARKKAPMKKKKTATTPPVRPPSESYSSSGSSDLDDSPTSSVPEAQAKPKKRSFTVSDSDSGSEALESGIGSTNKPHWEEEIYTSSDES